jgi:hypothetical protein
MAGDSRFQPSGPLRGGIGGPCRHRTASILPSEKPTATAQLPCQQGCKVEHYRGADWLRPRLQEPQKRWIPGERKRVRIPLPQRRVSSSMDFCSCGRGAPSFTGRLWTKPNCRCSLITRISGFGMCGRRPRFQQLWSSGRMRKGLFASSFASRATASPRSLPHGSAPRVAREYLVAGYA